MWLIITIFNYITKLYNYQNWINVITGHFALRWVNENSFPSLITVPAKQCSCSRLFWARLLLHGFHSLGHTDKLTISQER